MGLTLHQLLVFVAGYIVYGLSGGLFSGLGVLFPVIMDTFDATRAETSIIQSVYAAIFMGGGIVYGTITSKFGAVKTAIVGSLVASMSYVAAFWVTELPYLIATSVVTACGLGMCFVACPVGVRQFFHGRNSVVALAMISSSSSTTAIALTYILRNLSDSYGLRGTLLIIGGIELNCAALCLLWKPQVQQSKIRTTINKRNERKDHMESSNGSVPDTGFSINCSYKGSSAIRESISTINENYSKTTDTKGKFNNGYSAEKDENDQQSNGIVNDVNINANDESKDDSISDHKNKQSIKVKLKHLFRNHSYTFTILGMLFSLRSLNPYLIFLIDMYRDQGYSIQQGTTGLTIINMAAVLSKAAPAVIAHCPFYNTFLLPVSSTILASIAMILMTLSSTVVVLHILSGCVGLGLGVVVSVLIVTISELVEPEYLPEAMGLFMSLNGSFSFVSGLVTGHLRDTSGSYVMPQIITSVFTGLGSIMFIIAACLQRRKSLRLKQKKNSISYVTRL